MSSIPYNAAVQKFAQSRLSSQLELMGDDLDLASLNFSLKGKASLQLRNLITDIPITRTIQGASTIELNFNDPDRAVLRSGYLGGNNLAFIPTGPAGQALEFTQAVDVEIDGLWFRMVDLKKTGFQMVATFEDREVALLRSYPKKDDPHTYLTVSPAQMDRAGFMRLLISQVKELPIRVQFSPSINPDSQAITNPSQRLTKQAVTMQGLPGFGKNSDVTVKNSPATSVQLDTIERVLQVGTSLKVPRKLLVVSVMVITAESDAGGAVLNPVLDGGSIGIFQQSPGWGGGLGGTGTIEQDAHAFFIAAITANNDSPSLDDAALAQAIQHSGAGAATNGAANYGPWRTEAEHTVTVYLGNDLSPAGDSAFVQPVGTGPVANAKGMWTRGSQKSVGGKSVQVREDNWTCLQRLASEVGWVCYCVSGTIYIASFPDLMHQKPSFEFSLETVGVDDIDFDLVTNRINAQATVYCRASRWQAAPGALVIVENHGPATGRWIVQSFQRSLFNPNAEITLMKPQPTLSDAESATPVISSGLYLSNAKRPLLGGTTGGATSNGNAAATAATSALRKAGRYTYLQQRPMPSSLYASDPELIDCSAFVTLCFKQAGLDDPNYNGYNGQGDTETLYANCQAVGGDPQPGDFGFYGPWDVLDRKPHHVVLVTAIQSDGTVELTQMGVSGLIQGVDPPHWDTAPNGPLTWIGYFRSNRLA